MVMSTDQNSLSIPSCRLYSTFTACGGERLNLHKPAVMTMDCTSRYINVWGKNKRRKKKGGRQELLDVCNSLSFVSVLVRRVLKREIGCGGSLQRKNIQCPGWSSSGKSDRQIASLVSLSVAAAARQRWVCLWWLDQRQMALQGVDTQWQWFLITASRRSAASSMIPAKSLVVFSSLFS